MQIHLSSAHNNWILFDQTWVWLRRILFLSVHCKFPTMNSISHSTRLATVIRKLIEIHFININCYAHFSGINCQSDEWIVCERLIPNRYTHFPIERRWQSHLILNMNSLNVRCICNHHDEFPVICNASIWSLGFSKRLITLGHWICAKFYLVMSLAAKQ